MSSRWWERAVTNAEATSGHVRAEKAAPARSLIGRHRRRRPAISHCIGRPIQQPSFFTHPLTHPRTALILTGAGHIQEEGDTQTVFIQRGGSWPRLFSQLSSLTLLFFVSISKHHLLPLGRFAYLDQARLWGLN